MFSAANDTIPLFRPRRGRDDRDAGKKKLRVDGAAGRPNNAVWAQGRLAIEHSSSHTKDADRAQGGIAQGGARRGVRQRDHLVRRRRAARSRVWANPRNNRAARTKRGGQCANREHRPPPRKIKAHGGARCASSRRPPPPKKDQNAQTKHLGMARFARRA